MLKCFKIFFLCFPFLFVACDNSLDIDADYYPRMFVFSLLDKSDSVHYVRIQKSFLQTGINPQILATDPKNIYYQTGELDVIVQEWDADILMRSWELELVDGDILGIEKDSGFFANQPNVLYRFNAQLHFNRQYKIVINDNTNNSVVEATTVLVDSFQILFPSPSLIGLDFTDTTAIYYICRYAVNARLYDLQLHMHYSEINISTDIETLKIIRWTIFDNLIGDNTTGNGLIAYPINANAFFYFVQSELDPNPNVTREFLSMDYVFYAGGVEMYYNYLNFIANTGITEQYNYATYSNIVNANGIFSSIYKSDIAGLIISPETIDSLACGSVTGNLGFLSSPSNPHYPDCSN